VPARKNVSPPDPVTPAETFVGNLTGAVEAFQKDLTKEESVQALFVTPSGEVLFVVSVGALPPDTIAFEGFDAEGARTLSLVPLSAAHITLKVVPSDDDEAAPKRLGFLTSRDRDAPDAIEP
jgi:hypothetical protein